jgi:hypothetical protein
MVFAVVSMGFAAVFALAALACALNKINVFAAGNGGISDSATLRLAICSVLSLVAGVWYDRVGYIGEATAIRSDA